MNDIPIGSPPAPPGRHAAPQGWYPDPVDGTRERYWDGWNWSRNTREREHASQSAGTVRGGISPRVAQTPSGQAQTPSGQDPPPGQRPDASMRTADGVPVAGWGWRLLAGVVDLIIVKVVAFMAALPFMMAIITRMSHYFSDAMRAAEHGKTASPPAPTDLIKPNEQLWIMLITAVIGVAYFALMWRFASATPGQLLCGLRVVPFGTGRPGHPLSWGVSVLRSVIWSVPLAIGSLLLIFAIINALMPLWQTHRQTMHDLAAQTQVVKIK